MLKKGSTLKSSFVDRLISEILSGERKPGYRLPPERKLAEELGLSRGSVNQGILDLERMGFLRVVPRQGAFVEDFTKNCTPETLSVIMRYDSTLIDPNLFRDLMDMRILVERECTRLACKNICEESAAKLCTFSKSVSSASAEDLPDALYAYHRCLTQISGNAAYAIIFQSFETMLRNLIQLHYTSRNEAEKSLPLYSRLTEAICSGQCEEADSLICTILASASRYLNDYLSRKQPATADG
jgi:GntR family transcriptional repressor for pyruvate dehydrogenase complex